MQVVFAASVSMCPLNARNYFIELLLNPDHWSQIVHQCKLWAKSLPCMLEPMLNLLGVTLRTALNKLWRSSDNCQLPSFSPASILQVRVFKFKWTFLCNLWDTALDWQLTLNLKCPFLLGSWADMVPSPWKPLVDTWSSRPFMPTNPREAILTGNFSKVPLLTGVCSEEGIMMVSHIVREPERWSLLAEVDWWKHILEIGFHIHPEDATEENKRMMLDICKDYGMQIKFRFFNGCIVMKDLIPNISDKRLIADRHISFWPQLEVVFLKNTSREGGLLIDYI